MWLIATLLQLCFNFTICSFRYRNFITWYGQETSTWGSNGVVYPKLPSWNSFQQEWNRLAGKQVLTKMKHKATGGVSSNRDMPDFLEYLHYLHHDMGVLPALDTSLTGFLHVIIRGDGVPVGGRTWVQLSIGFANFGRLSRMLPYVWTLAVAVVPENDTVALSWLWRVNLRWIQKFINTGTMEYCGTEYPTRVFLGGDSPWLRHVLGITTHWMVARIWDNGSLEGAEVPRSAQANALWHDPVRSGKMPPVQGRGCTHKPLLQVPNPYFQVVMCILHALMCIGRIVANELHSLCVGQDPAVIVEVAQILRDYKTAITPKGKAEPDGEESWRLLVAWNQLSQVLYIDSSIDAAVKAMSRTLTALYQTWHDPLALQIGEVARSFRSALCPTSKSPYLVFFIYDCKRVVQNIKPYGMGIFLR